jgi:hypothetical protein
MRIFIDGFVFLNFEILECWRLFFLKFEILKFEMLTVIFSKFKILKSEMLMVIFFKFEYWWLFFKV